jgi:hypothetical protein
MSGTRNGTSVLAIDSFPLMSGDECTGLGGAAMHSVTSAMSPEASRAASVIAADTKTTVAETLPVILALMNHVLLCLPFNEAVRMERICKLFQSAIRARYPIVQSGVRSFPYLPSLSKDLFRMRRPDGDELSNAAGSFSRIFIGQLRREASEFCPRFLLSYFCPTVEVGQIQFHKKQRDGKGKGKGCVWLNVSGSAAESVLVLHHRLFLTTDEEGQEVVLAATTEAGKSALMHIARRHVEPDRGRAVHLPCSPVVMETATFREAVPRCGHLIMDRDGSPRPAYFSRVALRSSCAWAHNPYSLVCCETLYDVETGKRLV